MKSIALRFSENFAPATGTIAEHQRLIDINGYVYYGKMGNSISLKNRELVLAEDEPRILLILSGGIKRYWAYIDAIVEDTPAKKDFPSYYHNISDRFRTWFRVIRIEEAPKNIMSLCKVLSSGAILSEASKHSMSPYFVIEYEGDSND